MKKVAINGFGRIGRITLRNLLLSNDIEVVAINDLAPVDTLAHLFQYDSIHGKTDHKVEVNEQQMIIDEHAVHVYSEKEPTQLPWRALDVDVVIESTGIFRTKEGASKHLEAGAKKVIISAPASDSIRTVVLGVNDEEISEDDEIISNASCTTNCLAPMVKVLNESFGIESGYITTIHAYTADQNIHDANHKDLRRARAAAMNIIPTTTGAASAVSKVIPEMAGKLDGIAMRVPVPDGSSTDFTAMLNREVTKEEINQAFKDYSNHQLKGILEYSELPLVSIDIVGNPHSVIFDSELTSANGRLVKVVGWYDNEYGYAKRTAELTERL